jgi:tRNA pseudouridine38-40 synthase
VQPGAPSIQQSLNEALAVVANHSVDTVGAGRTDAGVHAEGQVAHFDTETRRADHEWLLGGNSQLPDDINILWVRPVANDFHARYSALSRSYRYRILNRTVRSALERHRSWWIHRPLDAGRMHKAAQLLVGEHDFSSFRASVCQSKTPVRIIEQISVERDGDHISVCCRANAFLHHMVRNIVGSLLTVGQGDEELDWIGEILARCDRREGGMTAPARGLNLIRVEYPAEFNLPSV